MLNEDVIRGRLQKADIIPTQWKSRALLPVGALDDSCLSLPAGRSQIMMSARFPWPCKRPTQCLRLRMSGAWQAGHEFREVLAAELRGADGLEAMAKRVSIKWHGWVLLFLSVVASLSASKLPVGHHLDLFGYDLLMATVARIFSKNR